MILDPYSGRCFSSKSFLEKQFPSRLFQKLENHVFSPFLDVKVDDVRIPESCLLGLTRVCGTDSRTNAFSLHLSGQGPPLYQRNSLCMFQLQYSSHSPTSVLSETSSHSLRPTNPSQAAILARQTPYTSPQQHRPSSPPPLLSN